MDYDFTDHRDDLFVGLARLVLKAQQGVANVSFLLKRNSVEFGNIASEDRWDRDYTPPFCFPTADFKSPWMLN